MVVRRLSALAAILLLAACGTETPGPVADEPSGAPATGELLTAGHAVTVLDDGDGAELCLGVVMESLPPQCGGPPLVGWDWVDHDGDYEEMSGVRWGEFAMTGTFDGRDFTPTEVTPGDEFQAPEYDVDETMFATPCPEPEGGWRVLDPATATPEAMDRPARAAARLPGYADLWVDQSRNPVHDEPDSPGFERGMNDPTLLTINVRVTDDVADAEATLRETWGGALCVTQAAYTQKELRRIMNKVMDLPGMLSAGVGDQQVEFGVIYDGGTLQATLDERYGGGMVRVESALRPVEQ